MFKGTMDEELFLEQFLISPDDFGNSCWNLFDQPVITDNPSPFCSPRKNCESPVSVFRYPPTPISDIECPRTSNELASLPPVEYCEDPLFRFSGQWADLDTEMQLWRNKSTQSPKAAAIFSDSGNDTTYAQLVSSDHKYITERSTIDSIAEESRAKRKGVDVGSATPNKKKTSKKRRITHTTISRTDLELHFGKTRKEAASCLDVSVATLKRNARKLGIPRWPFNGKSKGRLNGSANLVVGPQPETAIDKIPESDQNAPIPLQQLVTDTTMGDERYMTVKVKYKDDVIKFELSFTSKMANLEEEISKRLKLKVGSFKIKYLDEDVDWVLLSCDVDLEYCMRSLGKTTIKMSVLPIAT